MNKALVPMKAHYFLFNAGTGPIVPYLSVYARQLGFSSVIVGLIYTILPVFGMIAKPTFGAIADRFHCQKKIFLIAQLVTAAAFLSIFHSPKVPQDVLVNLSCDNNTTTIQNVAGINIDSTLVAKISDKNVLATCELNCPLTSTDRATVCKDWNLSEYCSSWDQRSFLISVPMSKILLFTTGNDQTSLETVQFLTSKVIVDDRAVIPVCSTTRVDSVCSLKCNENDINVLLSGNEIKDSDVYGMYQFWVFLILMIICWLGQAVTVSIGDAICFELLGDKPNRYGYQRMYGALGWGILSSIAGIIVDIMSKDKAETDYTVCFYMAAGFLVLDFFTSMFLKYQQTKMSTSILKDVGKLLVDVRIVVFLLWCICVGMCTGLMWNFLLWLVEDQANALGIGNVKTIQGVIMGVQCLGGELPFFFLSGKILKKIGHINAMSVVLVALGIRFILYSVIENPWYFIPVEFSNGITFGLFYACMASYASIVAPPGTEATMQGMVGAVFEGVGVSLGSFLAGQSLARISGQLTFRYFGIGTLAVCVIHLIAQRLILQTKDTTLPIVARKDSFQKIRLEDHQKLTSVEDALIKK